MADNTVVTDIAIPVVLGGATLLAMASIRASDIATRRRNCVDEIIELGRIKPKDSERIDNLKRQTNIFLYRYQWLSVAGGLFSLGIFCALLYAAAVRISSIPPDSIFSVGVKSIFALAINALVILTISAILTTSGLFILIREIWKGPETLRMNMKSTDSYR